MSSKFPEGLDMFQKKVDAQFAGDPNGDFVMAQDINELQDAILSIEKILGINPQGSKLNVGERITLMEGSSVLKVPSVLVYFGIPSKINGATTIEQAATELLKYDHIVLGRNVEDPTNAEYVKTTQILEVVQANRNVKLYGYIDCGMNTGSLSISELQVKIQLWKDMGAAGIYCGNFGFEKNVSRERQNVILDSIHQHNMSAMIQAISPEEVFSDLQHPSLNPEWVVPHIQEGDIYHYEKFVVDTSLENKYIPASSIFSDLEELHAYRKELGIRIFGTPSIRSNVLEDEGQSYFEYAHAIALLGSLDAFYPAIEGYSASLDIVSNYEISPIIGDWYVNTPSIVQDGDIYSRETGFGQIVVNTNTHTYLYKGIYIPFELLRIAANSIDGMTIKDDSIEDVKVKNYAGSRLIDAINAETDVNKRIDIAKIMQIQGGDISGAIPVDVLSANIIQAINAYVGTATIGQAFIGSLDASKITAGTIDAGRITASVVEALNLYAENLTAESAMLNTAVIKDLSAEKITAGNIEAARLQAGVVDAINLSAKQADIQNLNADNITAGSINADRIAANIVSAINIYTENMVAGSAQINVASIGELTAGHIRSSVVEAINLNADSAKINNAHIAELTAGHIQASVVDAINARIGLAVIDQAAIGNLDASKITAGTIDADLIKASVFEAINAKLNNAVIDSAAIADLNADKIVAGDIAADLISAQIINAMNLHAATMTAESAKINNAVIGALEAKHMKSAVIEALNASVENAVIDNAKIGELSADNMKANIIQAVNASLENAVIDQAQIGDLNAEKITAGNIDAERLKASVITAINGTFETVKIESGSIGTLSVDNMKAGVISAVNASIEAAKIEAAQIGSLKAENIQAEIIKAINASIETAKIGSAQIDVLTADHIKAAVMEAINFNAGTATIDTAVIGSLTVDNMKAVVVEAINSYTGVSVIGEAKIGDLTAGKIKSGDIATERLAANVLSAINAKLTTATIDSAVIGALKAENIQAEIIKAINASIETATIDAAQIGTLKAENIQAEIIKAINASIEVATINSAQIGELDADKMKANIIEAIDFWAGTATINEALIATLNADKITGGQIDADVLTANVVEAINATIQTAKIDQAKIGVLKAEHIQTEVLKAINASIETAKINAAQIGSLKAENIQAEIIKAVNASIETIQIKEAAIADLNASKITAGDIAAGRLTANVVAAINAEFQTAQINEAKIADLTAEKIVSGDIKTEVLTANVVAAVNAYVATMTVGSAKIDSGAIGVLSADHMQVAVINAINASIETADINKAKIGQLDANNLEADAITTEKIMAGAVTADEIATDAVTADKILANSITAIKIMADAITADKILAGSIVTDKIATDAITAIKILAGAIVADKIATDAVTADKILAGAITTIKLSADAVTADKILAGAIVAGKLSADSVLAINIITDAIESRHIVTDAIQAEHILAGAITTAKLNADAVTAEKIAANQIKALHIITDAIESRHVKAGTINSSHIVTVGLDASVIKTGYLSAALIQAGTIKGSHIESYTLKSNHIAVEGLDASTIKTGFLSAALIQTGSLDAMKITAGTITGREIAADTLTAREIAAGSITSDEIQAGSISAEHITTKGLDAQNISVYDSKTGQVLIGGGYLRIDGLDAGVVQSDNLAANGMFMTASSSYGIKRTNPAGEVIIGTESTVGGGNQIWKYDLATGEVVTTIDVPGKKPAFIAIDGEQKYAYVTVQGDDTIVQIDLAFDVLTDNILKMGKAPSRVKWTGDLLGDMKHLFVINSDQTDVNAPDSFFVLDVPPHSDFSEFYVHHQLVLGNGPYDFVVSNKDKKVYVTQKDQGDIAVFDASNMVTWNWKQVGAIPIAEYGTDNYHGGMEGGFGLGHAVGGTSSSSYNLNHGSHGGGHSAHGGGGYGVSDGTMKKVEPRGITLDSKENFLLVADAENNELVVISRIPKTQFDWPEHSDYLDPNNIEWMARVGVALDVYDGNPEQAIVDGFTMVTEYVPYMGYHFANLNSTYNADIPNTLMYVFDTSVNKYKLIGAEWVVTDNTLPSPVPSREWQLSKPAMATYADGLVILVNDPAQAPATHPETGSAFVSWSPNIYGLHFYYKGLSNPVGMFEPFNLKVEPYNATNAHLPPGFESRVDPNMPDSDYSLYVPPANGTGTGGSGDGGAHNHSVGEVEIVAMETEEPVFEAMHTESPTTIEDPHAGHDMGGGPDTTGQGTVWKWVVHRIPVGDKPEFIEVDHGKVWVTLQGDNHIVVMNESDLYRTPLDIETPESWHKHIRDIVVGAKPLDIIVDKIQHKIYVTVNGTNQIAQIHPHNEVVERYLPAGANVMGGAITPDGRYMYVANNGGVGSLSFVYPPGPYIGDAFIGLEGDINYQGAQFWVPDRTNWIHNQDGTLRSSSSVEFRINEPFLNEGGYVKLATQGKDAQYAQIEQDIFNVSNFSNGDNFADAVKEILTGNEERTLWYPNFRWMEDPGVSNVTVVQMVEQTDGSILRVETIPDIATYTIHYGNARIEFQAGIVPEEGWVEADYVFRANVWFKNHNASVLIATENSSSTNFNTFFEVDEFVPKFVTFDNQQTKSFDYTPIINPGVTKGKYEGLKYSYATNRVEQADDTSFTLSAIPISGTTHTLHDGDISSSNYVELPSGLQNVTIDLGAKYMLGKVKVWHFYQDGRTYHNTKTEVSEDGVTWKAIFDSAVDGEYAETVDGHEMYLWAYSDEPKDFTSNYVATEPVRYIRDWVNGNTINTNNHWVEVQGFADWELEEQYVYPDNTARAAQQIATNSKGIVSTDIEAASVTIDLKIDFTAWWYMTYLVGPEFGSFDIEMPTVMGGSHVLPVGNPYINKVAHKHVMSWPPGYHQAVIKQRSGKVAIDRFRIEDYQYFNRSATRIPSTSGATFTRYKIVPEQTRDYVGSGNQSTEGPYDTPRVNPDTMQPDKSVSIKYRMRVKSVLDAKGTIDERGTAYITSAIFEQGKLSSHWRPSSASDMTPGNRIEHWDGNQPHKTGIQWFHLANGAVRGTKILPSAIMDYHISPYAKIGEYKLDLNYATHRHGMIMLDQHGREYFYNNKNDIDQVMGWGTSGTSFKIAHDDHNHDHLSSKLTIHGPFRAIEHDAGGAVTTWYPINGVEVVGFKADYDAHVASADIHFTSAERTKLAGLTTSSTKVADSLVNGNILINDAESVVYTHPTGAGNNHVPTGGATGNFLKYSASGTAVWAGITWTDIGSKPTTFTPPIATGAVLGGVKIGSGLSVDAAGLVTWTHATGDGNLHVPATGTTNNTKVLKAGTTAGSLSWGQVQFTELGGTISSAQHGSLVGGSLHANVTDTTSGFMTGPQKLKLDGIEENANAYVHPLTHSLDVITETTAKKIMTSAERTKLAGIADNANNYSHPATHSPAIIVQDANNRFMTDAERSKLNGIQENAINQASADARYLLSTGGGIADQLTISSVNDATLTLNADTDNDALEGGSPKVIFKQDGGVVGAEILLAQSGAADNALVLAPFMDYDTVSPIKNYSVFVHDKKVWHEGNFLKSEFTPASHIGTNGSSHAAVTTTVNGFMTSADKVRLNGIADNANNYAHPTGDGNLHVPATSTINNTKVLKAGSTAGSISWSQVQFSELGGGITSTQHGALIGGTLHALANGTTAGFFSSSDFTKLAGIADSANNYVHPATHALDVITETAGLKIMTATERTKLAGISDSANNYVHPASHSADMITETAGIKMMTSAERTKLTGIADSANNYSHPLGDGNLHVPVTGTTNNTKVLKAGATAGSMSWAQVQFSELGGAITATQHGTMTVGTLHAVANGTTAGFLSSADFTKLAGIADNANNYAHPATHDLAMITETAGLKVMTAAERTKLAGIADSANNYTHPATHSMSMITETATEKIMTDVERTKLAGIAQSANNYAHPTGDGSLHVPATSTTNNTKVLKAGATAGSLSWSQVDWSEITSKPTTFTATAHTHTVSEITDLSMNYYNKTEANNLINAKGDVKSNVATTFSDTVTLAKSGLAFKIQPSVAPPANTVLFQLANQTGASLVTMDSEGDMVVEGNLVVRGTTTYNQEQTVQGDMNITGGINVTGSSVLGDDLTDQTTVSGDLRLMGNLRPIGKSLEVARFSVYGIGGDLQFQSDSTSFEEIVSHYSTFDSGLTGSVIPAVISGAERRYRLVVAYSTVGVLSDAQMKIVEYGTTNPIVEFTLPTVNGFANGMVRHFISPEFTTSSTSHTTFQAASAGVGKDLTIKYIEVVAYDYYA